MDSTESENPSGRSLENDGDEEDEDAEGGHGFQENAQGLRLIDAWKQAGVFPSRA